MAVRKVCVSCSQLNGLAGRMVGRGISPMKPPPMFRFPIPDVAEATPPAGAFNINNTNLKLLNNLYTFVTKKGKKNAKEDIYNPKKWRNGAKKCKKVPCRFVCQWLQFIGLTSVNPQKMS